MPGIIGMSAVVCESFQRKWYLIVGHPPADGVRRLLLGGISGIGKISAVVDRLFEKQNGPSVSKTDGPCHFAWCGVQDSNL